MTHLRVIEIFDSLQGEGYWTGVPMTFVRLAGCNAPDLGLGCADWCDTPGSWDRDGGEALDILDVVDRIRLPRLCLTGGEPLLQAEAVAELVAEAQCREIRVHLETNGTIDPPVGVMPGPGASSDATPAGGLRFDWAVVSPKPPAYAVAAGWDGLVDELKLVVDDHLDESTVERLAEAHPEAFVCVQPVWGRGSVERAVALVMAHPKWRLSLQTHKFLGIC